MISSLVCQNFIFYDILNGGEDISEKKKALKENNQTISKEFKDLNIDVNSKTATVAITTKSTSKNKEYSDWNGNTWKFKNFDIISNRNRIYWRNRRRLLN